MIRNTFIVRLFSRTGYVKLDLHQQTQLQSGSFASNTHAHILNTHVHTSFCTETHGSFLIQSVCSHVNCHSIEVLALRSYLLTFYFIFATFLKDILIIIILSLKSDCYASSCYFTCVRTSWRYSSLAAMNNDLCYFSYP